MKIGTKSVAKRLLGSKSFVGGSLGQKVVSGFLHQVAPAVVAHTADGIIQNYSNSADQAKEPIKGVNITTRSHQKHSSIEKHKRSKSGSGYKNFA